MEDYDGIKWYKTAKGYWYNHQNGYQHVYVWEQAHQATVDSPDDVIHHINEDKEDNRIENLQLMTRKEHANLHMNCSEVNKKKRTGKLLAGLQKNNMSGFRGVFLDKESGRWRALIRLDTKLISLGRFDSPEEAAHAYDTAARKYFGDDCFLNFPSKINADNKEAV